MGSARVILVFAWIVGTLGIVGSGWIWGKPFVHRIRLAFFASTALGLSLLGLDGWTVRHRPAEVHAISWADFPTTLANQIADAVYKRLAPLFKEHVSPSEAANPVPLPSPTPSEARLKSVMLSVAFSCPYDPQYPQRLQWRIDNKVETPVQQLHWHCFTWDLDKPELKSPVSNIGIQEPVQLIDFINGHDFAAGYVVPLNVPVEIGDQMYGTCQFWCLRCADAGYWLYFRQGVGGWYIEAPVRGAAVPSPGVISKNPEKILEEFARVNHVDAPKKAIGDWPIAKGSR